VELRRREKRREASITNLEFRGAIHNKKTIASRRKRKSFTAPIQLKRSIPRPKAKRKNPGTASPGFLDENRDFHAGIITE
jgi:hypothetical protein